MSEWTAPVVSIFNGVDQAAMLERLAESPLDDAEVGFLSDKDATGQSEVSKPLLAGIRIFAGLSLDSDEGQDLLAQSPTQEAEPPDAFKVDEGSRESFILFGPAGPPVSIP